MARVLRIQLVISDPLALDIERLANAETGGNTNALALKLLKAHVEAAADAPLKGKP